MQKKYYIYSLLLTFVFFFLLYVPTNTAAKTVKVKPGYDIYGFTVQRGCYKITGDKNAFMYYYISYKADGKTYYNYHLTAKYKNKGKKLIITITKPKKETIIYKISKN